MTHAFQDILRQRARRRFLLTKAAYLLRRGGKWVIAFAATALVVVVIAGIAEARMDGTASFHWPVIPDGEMEREWLVRLTESGDRAIAPGTGGLLVLFCGAWLTLLGVALLRLALRFGYGPLAIARTVIDEAVRNKTVVVLLSLLLVALAAWPYFTTAAAAKIPQPLRYQIQSFLSFSGMVTAALLGAVTILFAAYTVSTDINVRRTGDVFVKPISRFVYLFGKWLGVVSLMAIILVVQCMLVWGVCRCWLARNAAIDPLDMAAVYEQVLIARSETIPQPPVPFERLALERLQDKIRDEPELVAQQGRVAIFSDLLAELRSEFMSIPFGERKTYKFSGLQRARQRAMDIERRISASAPELSRRLRDELGVEIPPQRISLLTLAPYAGLLGVDVKSGLVQMRFSVIGINDYASATGMVDLSINGNTLPSPVVYVIDRVQIVDLPASYADENGQLLVEIINVYPDSNDRRRTIQFDPGSWIHVYHIEGNFGPNLVRGSWVHLLRLCFLAMLGVVTGALWSFPVAATFSLCVWILASGGSWLQETLSQQVAGTDVEAVDTAFNNVVLPIVSGVARMLSTYSVVDVSSMLADGRYIGFDALVHQTLWVGVVWMGVLLALGGYLFWRREIARVQV